MVQNKLLRWTMLTVLAFVFAQIFTLSTPQIAKADGQSGSFISAPLSGKVLDHQLYYWMASCFNGADMDKVTLDEVTGWRWFEGSGQSRVRGGMYENRQANCKDGGFMEEAMGRFGFTNALDTFCSLDFTYNRSTGGLGKTVSGGNTKSACIGGKDADDFDGSGSLSDQKQALDTLLSSSSKYAAAKAPLSNEAEYVRYYRTFMKECGISLTQPYTAGASGYKVTVVNQDGTTEAWSGIGDAPSTKKMLVATLTSAINYKTCQELADGLNSRAAQYATYLKTTGQADTGNDESGGSAEPVCSAGALGWVFCPLTDFISTATTKAAQLLEGQLEFRALNSEQGKAIQNIWGSVLTIANIGLVIAFLIVIFSQATSVGLSKYGIKKILPRIIAAAILMNLSFWICAAAVDLSNILGVSIKAIIEAGMATIGASQTDVDLQTGATFEQGFAAVIVALMAATAVGALGLLPLLLPVLAMALVAVITAFVVLAVRQVLIMLLIIVAPLAFLAWILPNTEEWFTKWRKLFTSMLIMFPIVMAIFYGSLLVSKVILATGDPGGDGDPSFMSNLIALVVLTVPLFSLPFIMKTAGGVLERFGLMVNNRNKGLVDRARKKGDELKGRSTYQQGRELRKRSANEYRQTKFANRLGKKGIGSAVAGGVGGNLGRIDALKDTVYGAQHKRLADYAVQAERKAASERRQAVRAGLQSEGISIDALSDRYKQSVAAGDVDAANAQLSHLALTYGAGGRQAAAEALKATDLSAISDTAKRDKMRTELDETIGGELYGSLITSRADIAKGGFRGGDSFGFTDISALTAPQIASQDKGVYQMGAMRGEEFDANEARIAMTNPELESKITDKGTRVELSRRSGVNVDPDQPRITFTRGKGAKLAAIPPPELITQVTATGGWTAVNDVDLQRLHTDAVSVPVAVRTPEHTTIITQAEAALKSKNYLQNESGDWVKDPRYLQ